MLFSSASLARALLLLLLSFALQLALVSSAATIIQLYGIGSANPLWAGGVYHPGETVTGSWYSSHMGNGVDEYIDLSCSYDDGGANAIANHPMPYTVRFPDFNYGGQHSSAYSDYVTMTLGSTPGSVTCRAVLNDVSLSLGHWVPLEFRPTTFMIRPYVKRTSGSLDAAHYYPGVNHTASLVSQTPIQVAYAVTLLCGAAFPPIVFVWPACASAPCTTAAYTLTMGAAGVYSCSASVSTDDTPSHGADLNPLTFSLTIAAAPVLTSVALNGATVASLVRSHVTFQASVASATGVSTSLTCTDALGGNAFIDSKYLITFPTDTVATVTPSAEITVRLNSSAAIGPVACALLPVSGDENFVRATVSLPAFAIVSPPIVSWTGLVSGGRYAVGSGPHRVQLTSTVAARAAVTFKFDCDAASWSPIAVTLATGAATATVSLALSQFAVAALGAAVCTVSVESTLDDNFAAVAFAPNASFTIHIVNAPTVAVALTGDGLAGAWYPGQTLRRVAFVLSEAPTDTVTVLLVCSPSAALFGSSSIFPSASYSFVISAGHTLSAAQNLTVRGNVGSAGPTHCVYSTSAATTADPNFTPLSTTIATLTIRDTPILRIGGGALDGYFAQGHTLSAVTLTSTVRTAAGSMSNMTLTCAAQTNLAVAVVGPVAVTFPGDSLVSAPFDAHFPSDAPLGAYACAVVLQGSGWARRDPMFDFARYVAPSWTEVRAAPKLSVHSNILAGFGGVYIAGSTIPLTYLWTTYRSSAHWSVNFTCVDAATGTVSSVARAVRFGAGMEQSEIFTLSILPTAADGLQTCSATPLTTDAARDRYCDDAFMTSPPDFRVVTPHVLTLSGLLQSETLVTGTGPRTLTLHSNKPVPSGAGVRLECPSPLPQRTVFRFDAGSVTATASLGAAWFRGTSVCRLFVDQLYDDFAFAHALFPQDEPVNVRVVYPWGWTVSLSGVTSDALYGAESERNVTVVSSLPARSFGSGGVVGLTCTAATILTATATTEPSVTGSIESRYSVRIPPGHTTSEPVRIRIRGDATQGSCSLFLVDSAGMPSDADPNFTAFEEGSTTVAFRVEGGKCATCDVAAGQCRAAFTLGTAIAALIAGAIGLTLSF